MIFHDHAYIFTDGIKFPRRDNIDVLQDLFGYSFTEAVEELEAWAEKHNILTEETKEPEVLKVMVDSIDNIDDLIDIPDGIDLVVDDPEE